MVSDGLDPRLVALDIDGTLLKWVEGAGPTYEQIPPRVRDAVHAAVAAGAHVVLASGRSPHGMTTIADLLGLPDVVADRLWVVASNGAVIFRYPPLEVVHEELFDARPAVEAVLREHPNALVAVEERGIGYRVNRPFPQGELSGDLIETAVDEMVARHVSRVIIRDPDATADDFVALAARLGLHGTDYVVGWTAWLDLSPSGVSKASGLERVCGELGLTAADVLAIGDGRNDLEMLRWAGRGVAMGQAVPEVHDAADADRHRVRRRRRGRARALVPVTPRLVATDLDGTLLDDKGRVSAYSREVLADLDARDVPVIFTTGRPVRWMEELWDEVGGHGLAICSNGGIVYDVAARRVREHVAVPRDVALELADLVRAAVPGTTFAVEHTEGWAREAGFPRHPDERQSIGAADFAGIYRDDVVKILAVHPELAPEEFWRRVDQAVGHLVTTTWSSTFALVEISASGVTKASALATLSAELGIDAARAVAFGDMPNDLPMLGWAGLACAVENAHPDVIAAADEVVPSNVDDGVARTLARLFA